MKMVLFVKHKRQNIYKAIIFLLKLNLTVKVIYYVPITVVRTFNLRNFNFPTYI